MSNFTDYALGLFLGFAACTGAVIVGWLIRQLC